MVEFEAKSERLKDGESVENETDEWVWNPRQYLVRVLWSITLYIAREGVKIRIRDLNELSVLSMLRFVNCFKRIYIHT